jgi:RNA polymerase sigma factor (sigma-70 family)
MSGSVQNDSYQEIWCKYLEGDKEALATLYFEFYDLLLNFGMKYSSNRYLVEDCIQNLFVDLLKKQRKQKSIGNIKFYLIKALRNQMSYEQRKTKKITSVPEIFETEFRITYSVENDLISNDTDQMREKFLKLVNESLTERQKEALYFKFNCGFDYDEIAELMAISVESTRTMVYRTIKTLKKTFGGDKYSNLIFLIMHFSFRKENLN